MSFQDIQKVTETEREVQAKKAAAQAEAKQIVAAAERAGLAAVEAARAKAEEQNRALLAQTEELTARQSRQTAEANDAACRAMQREAESRLDRAADLIVRRVVDR